MGRLHEMLIEDEIVLCGVILLVGIVIGAAARIVLAIRERRTV